MSAALDELIKREHLEGLIGKTHMLILQSLVKGDKTYTEIFEEIEGREYITSHWQVVRATDQLKRIGCVRLVGTKKTGFMAAPTESVFAVTDSGKLLLESLKKL